MMSDMTSYSFMGSVTALLVLEDMERLLIGTGSFIETYDLTEYNLLQRTNLFNDTTNTIQGFCRKDMSTKTMVYGGKTIKVIQVDVDDENTSFRLLQSISLCDWIMAVNWRAESIWAISAHNDLLHLRTICEFEKEVTIHCQDEKCILYSACLINDAKEVVVIGGTVFRQVLVWGSSSGQVYHRLNGHDGVIFSVAYSSELNLLCSTSDDRSLRLWKVSFEEGRDSGFKSWSKAKILPSHTLDNIHQSRVFRCLFLSSLNIVVSGGEDSTVAFWNVSTGQLLGKKSSKSSPIWSLAQYKSQVISGTGNGTVKVLRCPKQKLVDQVPLTDWISIDDCPRIVKFWRQRQIFILTLKGCLLLVTDSKTSLILQDDDLASYALMEITQDKLYFATIQGKIKWISVENSENDHCHEERISDGKIFALAYLAKSKRILTCIKDGIIQIHQELVGLNQIQKVGQLVLPFTKDQRWFSSVAEIQDLLLVGDRCGHLHVFDTTKDNVLRYSERAHNRQGIGFIHPLTQVKFLTGGRDGKVKTFVLEDDQLHLSCVQHLKLPWLERIEEGSRILCGFHSTDFVVHSLEDDKTIASIQCGGGHRSWDFNGTDLCFVKDKELMLASDLDKEITIKRGAGHLKEINCIEHLRFSDDENGTGASFLVTGGEDTTMKVWSLAVDNLSCLSTFRRHTSSIKCLATEDLTCGQKILVSAGGRAELRLWRIKWLQSSSSEMSCIEVAHHFLKGNDKQRLKTWRDHDLIDDTEPAFLSVAISTEVNNIFVSCSDGVVRRWSFDMDKRSLTFLSQSDTFPNAMLKILKLSSSGMVLAADTAGRLQVFDAQLQRKNVVENIHQNGINALLEFINGKIVISGGDDGHISLTNIEEMARDNVIPAHAAPITRLTRIPNGFCSVSIDQRITFYSGDNFDFKSQIFSHCPDIADAVVIEEEKRFIVVGNAIEIFALNS